MVCPLTDASGETGNVLNVFVAGGEGGTSKPSLVLCNQVRAVDCVRFRGFCLGTLSERTMRLVDEGLKAILDLG